MWMFMQKKRMVSAWVKCFKKLLMASKYLQMVLAILYRLNAVYKRF